MPKIDDATCVRCGSCTEVCPLRIYVRTGEGIAVSAERGPLCRQCGHCMAVCPTQAVSVEGLSYEGFPALPERLPPADEFARLSLARRSIRHYRPDPVPRDVLERILEVAAQAPAGVPPTTVEVTVICDRERLAELGPAAIKQLRRLQRALRVPLLGWLLRRQLGPAFVSAMGSFIMPMVDTAERLWREQSVDMITWGAPVVMVFHSAPAGFCGQENCIIAANHAMLAAHSLGLGTCWNGFIGGLLAYDRAMRVRMGIPASNKVHAALLLGYPAGPTYRRAVPRAFRAVQWV